MKQERARECAALARGRGHHRKSLLRIAKQDEPAPDGGSGRRDELDSALGKKRREDDQRDQRRQDDGGRADQGGVRAQNAQGGKAAGDEGELRHGLDGEVEKRRGGGFETGRAGENRRPRSDDEAAQFGKRQHFGGGVAEHPRRDHAGQARARRGGQAKAPANAEQDDNRRVRKAKEDEAECAKTQETRRDLARANRHDQPNADRQSDDQHDDGKRPQGALFLGQGRRKAPRSASSAEPISSARGSPKPGTTICMPTGKPAGVAPIGNESPARSRSLTKRVKRPGETLSSYSLSKGAGQGVVGVKSASNRSKIKAKARFTVARCSRIAFSRCAGMSRPARMRSRTGLPRRLGFASANPPLRR